jgi:hypothetical protein
MNKLKRYICNLLIVGYLGIIYFAGVPESNTLNFRLKQQAQQMAFALGIWPSWSMFAPNPIKFDSKTFVEVTYRDGGVAERDVEIELDGLLAPFRRARWMKYSQDNLRNPTQRGLLAPALRHFFQKYDSPERPVAGIKLKRKWLEVDPFNEQALPPLLKARQREEKSEILLTQSYEVDL